MQLTKDEIEALMPKPYRASGQQMSYDGYDKAHCHLFSIGQVHSVVSDAIAAHTAKVLEDVEPVGYIHPEDIKNIAVSDVEHCEIYSKPFSWDGAVYLPLYPAHTVAALKSERDALAARVAEMEKDAGRLDWAEENSAAWIKGYGQMYFGHTMANRGTIYANSFRAAIDAAALAAKGQA